MQDAICERKAGIGLGRGKGRREKWQGKRGPAQGCCNWSGVLGFQPKKQVQPWPGPSITHWTLNLQV